MSDKPNKPNKIPLDNEWDSITDDTAKAPIVADKGAGRAINNAFKKRIENYQWEDDTSSSPPKAPDKSNSQPPAVGTPNDPDVLYREFMMSLQKFCRPDKIELIKKQAMLVVTSKVQQAIKELKAKSMEW